MVATAAAGSPPAYIDSYYAATRTGDRRWPAASGEIETETCVVGGGLAGASTALELARRGRPVVLLEGARIGWGASGRNGGFLNRGFPIPVGEVSRRYGRDTARSIWSMAGETWVRLRNRAEALGAAVATGTGALRCRLVEHPDTLRQTVEDMNLNFDAGLAYVPAQEVASRLVTRRYADAYFNPNVVHVQPLNLVRALADEAAQAGAVIYESTCALELVKSGALRTIRTPRARIRAKHVVLAGGASPGRLHGALYRATVPVASFVVTTACDPERLRSRIRTTAAVSDTRLATDYYRMLPDGRLLWGGRASAWMVPRDQIARDLRRDIGDIFPDLADIPIEFAWGGWIPLARHRMPVICRLEEGIWAAACFGGHGALVNTCLAGELIAAAIADGDDRIRQFSAFGPAMAGGPFGRAAFQLIYWRHRAADRLVRWRSGFAVRR